MTKRINPPLTLVSSSKRDLDNDVKEPISSFQLGQSTFRVFGNSDSEPMSPPAAANTDGNASVPQFQSLRAIEFKHKTRQSNGSRRTEGAREIQAERSALAKRMDYAIPKLRLCLVNETLKPDLVICIQAPEDAVKLLSPLRHEPEEKFISLHLNAKNEVIGLHEVSHGTLSTSLVHPREVFKAALIANSYAILVCHNHPSGSFLTPSKEDLQTTEQLLKAGQILGVPVIDHLIVSPTGPPDYAYSIRENHPSLWN